MEHAILTVRKNEIEELVRLSYQAMGRSLAVNSTRLIDDLGCRERVNSLNREILNNWANPGQGSAYQEDEAWNQRNVPPPFSGPDYSFGTHRHRSGPFTNAREKELREQELLREKELREKENREKELREKENKEKELREKELLRE